jgi:small conductance mechanosensitive channel
MQRFFETRSHSWREVGLARELSARAVKRARLQLFILIPIGVATYLAYKHRKALFGVDTPARIIAAAILLAVGWQVARDIGRSVGPTLFRRMDPGTAGTVGFLLRLVTIVFVFVIAMRVVGLDPRTLAVGGAFTAVIFGLAAQQTLGNLIAGTVLLSARPFRVGDRVRLQGGQLAGQIEGVVSSLGLLYTTFASGEDSIMVPNSAVLSVAVIPLREPQGVDLRARLPADVAPSEVQALIQEKVQTPMRDVPRILLEELDGDDVVVRIQVTPERAADGPTLATEVLAAIAPSARGAPLVGDVSEMRPGRSD